MLYRAEEFSITRSLTMLLIYLVLLLGLGPLVQPQIIGDRAKLFRILVPMQGRRCPGGVIAKSDSIYLTGMINISGINTDLSYAFMSLNVYRKQGDEFYFFEIICSVNFNEGCNPWYRRNCYCMSFKSNVLEMIFNVTVEMEYQSMHLFLLFMRDVDGEFIEQSNPQPLPNIYSDARCVMTKKSRSKGHGIRAGTMILLGSVLLTSAMIATKGVCG
ncbi:unnamed protein product [Lymnaea stagnalis]|uniref:Uncharacterized protein n=1 Tax=Lymnaea stagnalis TaxID=6523 RepID=A0AAV2HLL5_LYMST